MSEQTISMQEYWKGFPEAPAVDTIKWLDKDGFDHFTTLRAWTPGTLKKAVTEFIAEIVKDGGQSIAQMSAGTPAPAPAIDPAAKIALEEGNKQMASELQQQAAEVGPAPAGKEWNIYHACFVKVIPQPDERVTIEFYGNDRKTPHNQFPELKVNKWELKKAQGLMKHVTSADLSKAAEFSLKCQVYWVDGKPKDNGGFWRDVHHVR